MADVVSPEKRSKMMAGIQGKNTRPEIMIRRGLHQLGFRYRLHNRHMPSTPDLVFPKYRAVILVHGCFWHGHNCHMFKWPSTRPEFWNAKITGNIRRDERNQAALKASGWRILIIWECVLKGRTKRPIAETLKTASDWLRSDAVELHIEGRK